MTPRAAATVLLMREGQAGLELLMVQRTPAARFMAGHWVFPGGAVDPSDGEGQAGLRTAAVRELAEETAVALPAGCELVPFARWITPAQSAIRFDTWFYLAAAPTGVEPRVDGMEIVDFRWLTAEAALRGDLALAFPTRKQLEILRAFTSAEEALAHARERVDAIRPIEPRIEDGRIVLD